MHPLLWRELAPRFQDLLVITNGVRLVATLLALTIVTRWAGSAWHVIRCRPETGDAQRAGWVPMAVGVLIFNARWFGPALTDLTRGRMALAAQFAVLTSLAFALYVHGRDHAALTVRRALIVFLALLVIGIGASAVLR